MLVRSTTLILLFALIVSTKPQNSPKRPHIIFILADDLGFNDVGFHGSNEIPTPNIDALAYSGLILNNYYVTPICTPSRSALMTGKYPIHTGMQHTVLYAGEPRGLPLTEKLLPEYLKELGYATHIVGKWHLGSFRKEYTPLYRGFESHLGFWTGRIDYYDHTSSENGVWGLDFRKGMEPGWDLHGSYCTDLFTKEAVRLINNHNVTKPLFLYVAHSAVHSGNPYNPLPAPDEAVGKFPDIENYNRRKFAAMMSKLDDSVGEIVTSLKSTGMLENSVVIFSTDNGGPAEGFNMNAASNWPLRGVKNTLWEGGVRGAGLLFSPLLEKPSRIANQSFHISDWLPTLYSVAGGNVRDLGEIDGVDLWDALSTDGASSRTQILHNIDDIYRNSALTEGDWKLVKGTHYGGAWDSWYGPSGRSGIYNTTSVTNSPAGKSLSAIGKLPEESEMEQLRSKADVFVKCNVTEEKIPCEPLKGSPCLFRISEDPCERRNVANQYPEVLEELLKNLAQLNATALPPANLPIDPRSSPEYWDHTWTTFGEGDNTIM